MQRNGNNEDRLESIVWRERGGEGERGRGREEEV
jgi:hypothetical protein